MDSLRPEGATASRHQSEKIYLFLKTSTTREHGFPRHQRAKHGNLLYNMGLTAVAPSGRPFHPKYRLSIRGVAPALTAYGLSGRGVVSVMKRLRVLIVSSFVIKIRFKFWQR